MNLELPEIKTGPDRFATAEEIRAAISLFPEQIFELDKDALFEVVSDLGGYVNIDLRGESEILDLLESPDELIH